MSKKELCGDNRFELIEKAKKELISKTNIETCQEEMAVLDNILFRMWQMGWLPSQQVTKTCDKAKEAFGKACGWLSTYQWYQAVASEFVKALEE